MYLALGSHGEQQMETRTCACAVRHHFFPSGFEYTLLGSFEKKSLMYFATLRFVTSSTFGFVAFALISFSIICHVRIAMHTMMIQSPRIQRNGFGGAR